MELTTVERIKLLEILPPQGDILTLKIVRKLRETLSFNEDELKLLGTKYEFVCPFQDKVDGEPTSCKNKGFWPIAPKCAEHDILMVKTGQLNFHFTPEMQAKMKEIHMGLQAITIVSDTLKRANETKQLTDTHISLYDKFFPPIPEVIEEAMSE